jgi:ketosteroid isomerase-like protein
MTDNISIARASYEAYARKDRAKIEALIAEDFNFTSPLDNRLDRETYFTRCWPNSETVKGFEFIDLVPDGDRVFVRYEGIGTGNRRFRNTKILTVRDGRIREVEVYFGWSIPHEAPEGGYVDQKATGAMHS